MSKNYYVKSKQHSGGKILCGQREFIVSANSVKEAKSKFKNIPINSDHKIVQVMEIKNEKFLNETPFSWLERI
jgi:hypothetical protein